MTDAKLRTETEALLQKVMSTDPETLGRATELGQAFSFTSGQPDAKRVIDLFGQIAPETLLHLSGPELQKVHNAAHGFLSVINQISSFDPGKHNPPGQARDALLQQLRQQYDAVFGQIIDSVNYSARRTVDFGALQREVRATIEKTSAEVAAAVADLKTKQKEADAALAAVRQAAEEAGVSQQALHFQSQADEHRNAALIWMRATGGMALALLLAAIASAFITVADPLEAVQRTIAKVFGLGAIAYLTALCARNYAAERHNEVVNRHRQKSLATYKALVEAGGDQVNRDVVLARAAESIFGAQSSGFSTGREKDSAISSMIHLGQSVARPPGGSDG